MCFLGKEDTCSPALTQVTAAWKTPPQNKDQNFPLVLSFIPMLCKLLSLLFLLDATAVILSERIFCVGKGSVNTPSITICVNMNFTAFLGFITIVRASLNQTPQQAAQRYYRSSWIKTLICTSLSPSCSSTPQILAIGLVQTLVIDLVWLSLPPPNVIPLTLFAAKHIQPGSLLSPEFHFTTYLNN